MNKEEYNEAMYPEISEIGKQEAGILIEKFKKELQKAANTTIGDLYCDILPHIESDAWTNVRGEILRGLTNYTRSNKIHHYEFVAIRKQMLKENRAEIIKDLNQDMLKEIESLKREIKTLNGFF